MKLNSKSSFLLGYLFVAIIFWWAIQASGLKDSRMNIIWGLVTDFCPTFGGIFGIYTARRWGLKSAVGRAIFYISLGLFSWAAGNWIWAFYNFFENVSVPYPSLADVGYVAAVPLWMTGVFYLSKATGARFGLKWKPGRLYLIILPIITTVFSYYLLVTVARQGVITSGGGLLKIIFDFAYPIGDVVIITIALLVYGLSFKYLGGRYKWPVIVTLFGFVVMFCADFSFSYMTTLNTYFNGCIADLFFVMAMFTISFGIISIDV